MEDFGDRYVYAEWRDIITHVFALLDNGNNGKVAAAVTATWDAQGIVLPSVNSAAGPSASQVTGVAHPQSTALNGQARWMASRDGDPAHNGGLASLQRASKKAYCTVYEYLSSLL
jgi:hypothetical protein